MQKITMEKRTASAKNRFLALRFSFLNKGGAFLF